MKSNLLYNKGTIRVNDIDIYFEAFGDPADPAVILITGMDDLCTSWITEFYGPFVEKGYYVIRFDNRDCGLSTWINEWDDKIPYTIEDMSGDTLGLMNSLKINRAHFIGASMGGMIAQRIAVSFPDRIRTLTSIASSGFPADPDPALKIDPSSDSRQVDSIPLEEKYPNRDADFHEAIEYRLEALKMFSGSRVPFDEALQREILKENFFERKGYNPLANLHQTAAIMASGSRLNEIENISVPSLVIHGTEDPLLHPGHAVKCAAKIPGAKLVLLEGIGHEFPLGIMDTVHKEIFDLFSLSSKQFFDLF